MASTEKRFSKAQMRHFNDLQRKVEQAQLELQNFTNYLSDELEVGETPKGKAWIIGRYGFELVEVGGTPAPEDVIPEELVPEQGESTK